MTAQNAGGVDALLPCPFCGATPNIGRWKDAIDQGDTAPTVIECSSDLHDCPASPSVARWTREETIAAWNQRASAVSPDAATVDDAMERALERANSGVNFTIAGFNRLLDANEFQGLVLSVDPADCRHVMVMVETDAGNPTALVNQRVTLSLQAARVPDGGNDAVTARFYQHLLDMLGAKDHIDAGRIIGELHSRSLPDGAGGKAVAWPDRLIVAGPADEGYDAMQYEYALGWNNAIATAMWNNRDLSREGASVSNAVRGLVAKWREIADGIKSAWNSPNGAGESSRRLTYKDCAEQLERALATPNPTTLAETAESVPASTKKRVDKLRERDAPGPLALSASAARSGGDAVSRLQAAIDRAIPHVTIRSGISGGSEYQDQCATEALRTELREAVAALQPNTTGEV